MSALQGHVTSNINAITQQAALVALQHPELIQPLRESFRRRRDLVRGRIASLPRVHALDPEGAFYAYLDVRELLGSQSLAPDGVALASWLLDEHHLAVVPGAAFGDPSHLRLSFAASDEDLNRAFDRLDLALR